MFVKFPEELLHLTQLDISLKWRHSEKKKKRLDEHKIYSFYSSLHIVSDLRQKFLVASVLSELHLQRLILQLKPDGNCST